MPVIRREVKVLAVLAFWILFALAFFRHWPLPFFKESASGIVWLLLILLSASGYGQALTRRALPRTTTSLEFLLFSIILGLGLLSFLMTLLGAAHAWTSLSAKGMITVGLVLQVLQPRPQLTFIWESDIPVLPATLLSVAAAVSLLTALAPVTYYDSLVYHFAMPAVYLQVKHWLPLTSLIYSAFPQNCEMLWGLGLLLANETVANFIGWSLAAVTVLGVFAFSKRYVDARSGWYASVWLATMPTLLLLSTGGYVDVGLTCFSFMSFYALFLWRDAEAHWTVALAGALGGWAMGCKYTGAISIGIGALFVFTARQIRPAVRLRACMIYGASALVVMLPWLIKNYHYVGNPLFPFFHEWGMAQRSPWVGQAASGYFAQLSEYEPHKPWEIFQLLWDATTNGLRFGGGIDLLGLFGWAGLFAFLPGLFLVSGRPAFRWLLIYVAAFCLVWGMTRPVLRFLLPIAPILAILSGRVWAESRSASPAWFRWSAQLFAWALLASNAALYFHTADLLALFSVPLGGSTRQAFLEHRLDYFGAAEFVNQEPSVLLALVVGDQRGYYYEKPVLVTPVFSRNPLVDWAETASSADNLQASLRAQGITHLIINHAELKRLEPYHLFPFSDAARARWETMQSHLRPIYRDAACEVLVL